MLQERYPDLRVLRNPGNFGYGGGNNVGLRRAIDAGAAYVLLLNNDAVVAPDCVRSLVAAVEADCRIGMATPRVFYYDRPTEIYWDGGVVDWESGDVPHDSRDLPVEAGIVRSEWLNGCSLLVRAATIRDIGLLDEPRAAAGRTPLCYRRELGTRYTGAQGASRIRRSASTTSGIDTCSLLRTAPLADACYGSCGTCGKCVGSMWRCATCARLGRPSSPWS